MCNGVCLFVDRNTSPKIKEADDIAVSGSQPITIELFGGHVITGSRDIQPIVIIIIIIISVVVITVDRCGG